LDKDVSQEVTREEKMSAESILADIKERGSKFFDSEGVRDGLRDRGLIGLLTPGF